MDTSAQEKKRYYARRRRYRQAEQKLYASLQGAETEREYTRLFARYCKVIGEWKSEPCPPGVRHNPDPPLKREWWYWPDFSPEYVALTRRIRELQRLCGARPEAGEALRHEIAALRVARLRHMTARPWEELCGPGEMDRKKSGPECDNYHRQNARAALK